MKVRRINFDFADASVLWSPEDPEFAQFWNAASTLLPYVEPFGIRVVGESIRHLSEEDAELAADARVFMGQEAVHYRNHARFNELLTESGYPGLARRVAAVAEDYKRFSNERGFRFRLAYIEGFETAGPILAAWIFEESSEIRKPSVDETTVALWRWHLAEEQEHRHVANHLFERLDGSYPYRVFGVLYATHHLFSYLLGTMVYLLDEDYAAGRIRSKWRSRIRMVGMLSRLAWFALPRLAYALTPFYEPLRIPTPESCAEVLRTAEARWG